MENVEFTTQDGFNIRGSVFQPNHTPKAGIIINSATAVGRAYYQAFAEYLCGEGYLVLTYDYRGIGGSKSGSSNSGCSKSASPKLSMRAWGEQDFEAAINWSLSHYPALSWHCIGHSVGGQLVGLAASNSKLASVYCVASQNGYWKHWGLPQKPKLLLIWYGLIPLFSKTMGRVPGFILGGTSLPADIALEWARWCRHPDFITDDQGQPIREHFSQYQQKMRFLAIKDDLDFAPVKAVKALQRFYVAADKELQVIDPKQLGIKEIGHFGFFKRQNKEQLWPNTLEWLTQFSH